MSTKKKGIDLGRAYVQIIPSALGNLKKIQDAVKKSLKGTEKTVEKTVQDGVNNSLVNKIKPMLTSVTATLSSTVGKVMDTGFMQGFKKTAVDFTTKIKNSINENTTKFLNLNTIKNLKAITDKTLLTLSNGIKKTIGVFSTSVLTKGIKGVESTLTKKIAPSVGNAFSKMMSSDLIKGAQGKIAPIFNKIAPAFSGGIGTVIGTTLTKGILGGLATLTIGGGVGISSILAEGGELEQTLGGVETLFKKGGQDFSKEVIKNANIGFKTAGISANEYMKQATSFSASLINSLNGDVGKAVKITDMAIRDMADNSNKASVPLESIQMAYQGFARGQFMLLDNLKLGYTGTKTEMERLLADATKLSGVEYNIDNLADIYTAIHVIQKKLNFTGTTAKESTETFQGSLLSLKATYYNLLGSMALKGKTLQTDFANLLTTLKTFGVNLWRILSNTATSIFEIITPYIPKILNFLSGTISTTFNEIYSGALNGKLAEKVDGAVKFLLEKSGDFLILGAGYLTELINGLFSVTPKVMVILSTIGTAIIGAVAKYSPSFFKKGIEFIGEIIKGLVANIPSILTAIGGVIVSVIRTVTPYLMDFYLFGWNLIVEVVKGILAKAWEITTSLWKAVKDAIKSVKDAYSDMKSAGVDLVKGLIEGVKTKIYDAYTTVRTFASGLVGKVKEVLGIASPSRVFKNEVGAMISQGIAYGIIGEKSSVQQAMDEIERETNRNLKSFIGINSDINSNNRNLDYQKSEQPANVTLKLGNHAYKTFVNDITATQDDQARMQLLY